MRFRRVFAIPVEECFSEVATPQVLEIHRQEADVVENVTPPQTVVELESIEDPWPVVETEDVLGEKIAVTVDDATPRDPLHQQAAPAIQVLVRELADSGHGRRSSGSGTKGVSSRRFRVPEVIESSWRRDRRDQIVPGRRRVACGDGVGDGAQASGHVAALPHPCRQPAISRQSSHQHRVVDNGPVVVDDVLDPQVDIAGEAAVEVDFSTTHLRPQLRRAQVDEREPHRLLALVHDVAIEDDRRDVRLDDR